MIKSWIFTIRSPRFAVRSKTSISNSPNTYVNALNASFIPPPVIVVIRSKIVNNPLNVRRNLSASSSVTLNCFVRSSNLFIALYRSSDDVGVNVSCHAFPIAENVFTMFSPIFLNPSIRSSLPDFLSAFSLNNSEMDLPVLSDWSFKSWRLLISASVRLRFLSSSSDIFASDSIVFAWLSTTSLCDSA